MTAASYQIKSKNSPTKTKTEKPFSLPFKHTSVKPFMTLFPPADGPGAQNR